MRAKSETERSMKSDQKLSLTIQVIKLRAERELADVRFKFDMAGNTLNYAIKNMEIELDEAMSTAMKDEVEKKIARLRKILTKVEQEHDLKVKTIQNAAKIKKRRAKGPGDNDAIGSQAKSVPIEKERIVKLLENNSSQRPDGRWETKLSQNNMQPFPCIGDYLALQSRQDVDGSINRVGNGS